MANDLRIVLLGKTQAGKSATGNTILVEDRFNEGLSPEFVTATCKRVNGNVENRRIHIIDTPGIDKIKDREMERCMFLSDPGPHVFLLVIKLGRFTKKERRDVNLIKENFGTGVLDYSIVLFTHADLLKDRPLDEFLSESSHLQSLIQSCGKRYLAINNNEKNQSQVTKLLEMIDEMVQMQKMHYTKEMFKNAQLYKRMKRVGLAAGAAVGGAAAAVGGLAYVTKEALLVPPVVILGGIGVGVASGAKIIYDWFK